MHHCAKVLSLASCLLLCVGCNGGSAPDGAVDSARADLVREDTLDAANTIDANDVGLDHAERPDAADSLDDGPADGSDGEVDASDAVDAIDVVENDAGPRWSCLGTL